MTRDVIQLCNASGVSSVSWYDTIINTCMCFMSTFSSQLIEQTTSKFQRGRRQIHRHDGVGHEPITKVRETCVALTWLLSHPNFPFPAPCHSSATAPDHPLPNDLSTAPSCFLATAPNLPILATHPNHPATACAPSNQCCHNSMTETHTLPPSMQTCAL